MEGYWLTEEALDDFGYLIPDFYRKKLKAGSVLGIGIVEPMNMDEIVATILIRESNGWIELVWMALDETYRGMGYSFDVLWFCLEMFQKSSKPWGMFMDLPEGKAGASLQSKLEALGFEIHPITRPCYTLSLGKIKQSEFFLKYQNINEKAGKNLRTLAELSAQEKAKIERTLSLEPIILPLQDKLDFSRYEEKLSQVRYDAKGNPDGILLATKNDEHLTLECVWGKVPTATAQMLCGAVKCCDEYYSDETEIVVPTVTEASQKLAERLMPNAQPIQGLQARKLFS